MEASLAIRVPLATAPAPTPAAEPCPVCPRIASEFEGWRQSAYWRAQHGRARDRERQLKERIKDLEAQNRLLKQKIFGKSTETKTGPEATTKPGPAVIKRPRGQQRGHPNPSRRNHDQLPAVEEIRDLPDEQRHCACCGLPFAEFPGTEDSEILEVEVKAHRRVIRRPGAPGLSAGLFVSGEQADRGGSARPARDSQEQDWRIDLGADPDGQVPVPPAHLSLAGITAVARPGPVARKHHR